MDQEHPAASAVRRAAEIAGGLAALGTAIGLPGQSARAVVWAWTNRGVVPIEHCAAIEKAAGRKVTRRDLRPDDWHRIWPELVTKEHPAPSKVDA
jgi:DNA-binding transcriptional regulator YdaS (Cro superfamily)